MPEAYIVEAVRTPVTRRGGGLAAAHPADLGAHVIRHLLDRAQADPETVDDVMFGCVDAVGPQAGDIARTAWLAAGLPEAVPGVTVDRQCGSSQQAVHFAAQAVLSGTADLVVAGGVQNMSMVPIGSAMTSDPFGGSEGWRARYGTEEISQFRAADLIAEKWDISRAEMERYALASHQRALRAIADGAFEQEIAPYQDVARDEGPRADTTAEKMAGLKPLREGGRITAALASQISDGAAALLIASERAVSQHKLQPRARIRHLSARGDDPVLMLTAPIAATAHALHKTGLTINDIDLVEINEAFASVVLAWQRETGADLAQVNVAGGAIALGHPLGATGARLLTTLLHALERTGGRRGLLTMCEGGGQANVTIIERLLQSAMGRGREKYKGVVDFARAKAEWEKVVASGDPDRMPEAQFNLGIIWTRLGRAKRAEAAFRQAVDSGHAEFALRAADQLAASFKRRGARRAEEAFYRQLAGSGQPALAPIAACRLGELLFADGDHAGSCAAYQLAVDSGEPRWVHEAWLRIAAIRMSDADYQGALPALERVAGSGEMTQPGSVYTLLGHARSQLADLTGAETAYREAIATGDPEQAPLAAIELGNLLVQQDDLDGARSAYQAAIDSENARFVPGAARGLGNLLWKPQDRDGALAAYRIAKDSGEAKNAPLAARSVATILRDRGDTEGARAAYQVAIDSGDARHAPAAANSLGNMLASQGDNEGAQQAYQVALAAPDPARAGQAALNLGRVLAREQDEAGAERALRRAVESGNAEAYLVLGELYTNQGRLGQAHAAFKAALDSGQENVVPYATIALGIVELRQWRRQNENHQNL